MLKPAQTKSRRSTALMCYVNIIQLVRPHSKGDTFPKQHHPSEILSGHVYEDVFHIFLGIDFIGDARFYKATCHGTGFSYS